MAAGGCHVVVAVAVDWCWCLRRRPRLQVLVLVLVSCRHRRMMLGWWPRRRWSMLRVVLVLLVVRSVSW